MCCTAGIYWAKELKSSSSLVRRNNHTAVLVSQVLGIANNKRSHLTMNTSFVFLKFFHKSLEFSSFGLKRAVPRQSTEFVLFNFAVYPPSIALELKVSKEITGK